MKKCMGKKINFLDVAFCRLLEGIPHCICKSLMNEDVYELEYSVFLCFCLRYVFSC